MLFKATLAALVAGAMAKDGRTFAVLRFYGSDPLVETRADPIVQPGVPSSHVHTIMGGSNFGFNSTGEILRQSSCTNSLLKADLSNYWVPKLYFRDPKDGHFEPVEMFYMNVYYFFEGTNDQIKAFPTGLQMVSGNNALRAAPAGADGNDQLDPSKGPVQPAQITCPRSSFDPPNYPLGSDGSMAGIQDPNNKGAGMGFPTQECDGYASPMRADLHFPSCYNPAAGLTNYKNNMQFPVSTGNNKQDCPAGWIHTPHIFFEMYWNTPKFVDRWTRDGKTQPFVFSNGDATGFSLHGDFMAAWDEDALQTIIDTCDAGDSGMDKCPQIKGGLNDKSTKCTIPPLVNEQITGSLSALPGNNPIAGWQYGAGSGSGGSGGGAASSPASSPSSAPAASQPSSQAPPVQAAPSSSAAEAAPPANTKPAEPVPTTPTTLATSAPAPATTEAPATPASSASGGDDGVETVWETITQWKTATVYDEAPAPSGVSAAVNVTSKPDISGFKYVGCYQDQADRNLAGKIRPSLGDVSTTACVTYCVQNGWSIAGTEYGGQCYCGNSLVQAVKLDESSCDAPCEGAAGETCGGDWALTLYTKDGAAPAVGASGAQKRHLHNHLHHHANRRGGPSARRR